MSPSHLRLNSNGMCVGGNIIAGACRHYPIHLALYTCMLCVFLTHDHNSNKSSPLVTNNWMYIFHTINYARWLLILVHCCLSIMEISWTTFLCLFSDILQPWVQPDLRQRSSCSSWSFASEPEPSGAKVSPAILFKRCTDTVDWVIPILVLKFYGEICFLTYCSLSRNKISDIGAHELAAPLQVNQSLQELTWVQPLMYNFLGGELWL